MRALAAFFLLGLLVACSENSTPFVGDGGPAFDGGSSVDGGQDGGVLPDGGSDGGGNDGGAIGTPCQRTLECGASLYCGPTRACETAGAGGAGATCTGTGDCQAGLICLLGGVVNHCGGAGSGDVGSPCDLESDCLAGLSCLNFTGTPACQSPPPLPDGGTFVPPVAPWAGAGCTEDNGPARAYFDVPRGADAGADFYRLPFPNDIRRTEDGLDLSGHPHPAGVLPVDLVDAVLRASEQDLRGFSVNPVVFFRFSKRYDWDSVGAEPQRIHLVDITPNSPTYKLDHFLSWVTTYGPVSRYICNDWIGVRPPHGTPLRASTTYAAFLTTGITPLDGGTFARSADLDAMLAASPPQGAALQAAYAAYAPLRSYLADTGTDPGTILNAAVFTTQDPEVIVPDLRAVVRSGGVPAVSNLTRCEAATVSPCDDGSGWRSCSPPDDRFVEVHGRIALPIFQQGTAPYLSSGGDIAVDLGGSPTVARTEAVCFALTVPKDVAPPGAGFPVLIDLHGTGGSFTDAVRNGLAGEVAAGAGAATLAIDLPQHGARRGGSTLDPAELFYNFLNPRAARDNVAQGTADLFSLVRWAESYTHAAGESPTGQAIRFDPGTITLFAHSQGATHASLALPHEPGIFAAVLSGNGGDLTLALLHKTQPFDIARAVPYAIADGTIGDDGRMHVPAGDYHPALAIVQGLYDRSDPVNFARRLRVEPLQGDTGRHVFMTYGIDDHYSPPETLKSFAIGARFVAVTPVIENFGLAQAAPGISGNVVVGATSRTFGLRQYLPDPGDDGHFVALDTDAGRADVMRFLLEALAGDAPHIGAP